MKPYTTDFKAEEQGQKLPPLPAGAYVAVILGVKAEEDSKGQTLTLQVDVTEGDYKGYYYKQYKAAEGGKYPARYKGVFRMTAPNPGSEYYEIQDRVFRSSIWAIEQSNQGYTWAWDETTLKNKMVGIVVRERDWEKDGLTGTTTEIGALTSVQKVREGKAPVLKKRELKRKPESSIPAGYVPISDEPLPF